MKRSLILTTALFSLGAVMGAFAQTPEPRDYQPPSAFDSQPYPDQRAQQMPPQQMPPQQMRPQDDAAQPAVLTIRQGTYVAVRVNQWLSSDHNQQGDSFFGSLESPIVVNGVVLAQRGQNVSGRVSEAVKAGRVQGTSRLGLQLTDLTVADGQQIPIETQLVTRNGSTSEGRDAAAIGTTTALGAIIGAGADWGRGAAIGAGAGAAAGIIGVLLTRGNPTVVYPESVLTFRLERSVDVDTSRGGQAFRYVDPQEYNNTQPQRPASYGTYNNAPPRPAYGPAYGPAYPPPPAYYGGYYAGYGWGYGPGFSVVVGPHYGYYRGGGYYYRGGRRW